MEASDKIGGILLYIVRHCEVDSDGEGKIRGLQNQSLNEEGDRQCAELAEFFKDIPISAVYSDDLKRTYHTAITIAHTHDLEVTQDVDLRSWDVGSDLEGRSIEANEDEIRELKLQPDKIPVGGESWAEFERKAISTFEKYTSKALDASAPIVIVIHGSGIQAIWDYLGIVEKSGAYDATPIDTAGIAAISMTRRGFSVKVLKGAKDLVDA